MTPTAADSNSATSLARLRAIGVVLDDAEPPHQLVALRALLAASMADQLQPFTSALEGFVAGLTQETLFEPVIREAFSATSEAGAKRSLTHETTITWTLAGSERGPVVVSFSHRQPLDENEVTQSHAKKHFHVQVEVGDNVYSLALDDVMFSQPTRHLEAARVADHGHTNQELLIGILVDFDRLQLLRDLFELHAASHEKFVASELRFAWDAHDELPLTPAVNDAASADASASVSTRTRTEQRTPAAISLSLPERFAGSTLPNDAARELRALARHLTQEAAVLSEGEVRLARALPRINEELVLLVGDLTIGHVLREIPDPVDAAQRITAVANTESELIKLAQRDPHRALATAKRLVAAVLGESPPADTPKFEDAVGRRTLRMFAKIADLAADHAAATSAWHKLVQTTPRDQRGTVNYQLDAIEFHRAVRLAGNVIEQSMQEFARETFMRDVLFHTAVGTGVDLGVEARARIEDVCWLISQDRFHASMFHKRGVLSVDDAAHSYDAYPERNVHHEIAQACELGNRPDLAGQVMQHAKDRNARDAVEHQPMADIGNLRQSGGEVSRSQARGRGGPGLWCAP